jgi:small-conductance mechanosensitive channel
MTAHIPMLHILTSLNLYALSKDKIELLKTTEASTMASSSRLNVLLEKVKNLISGQRQKEKEETAAKSLAKKEKSASSCPHRFGYLASRSKNAPIPRNA